MICTRKQVRLQVLWVKAQTAPYNSLNKINLENIVKKRECLKFEIVNESYLMLDGIQYKRIYSFNDCVLGNNNYNYYIFKDIIISLNLKTNKGKFVVGFKDNNTKNAQVRVKLLSNSKSVSIAYGRLVACNAYPATTGRVAIKYKDGNRLNNAVENLELIKSDCFKKALVPRKVTTIQINGRDVIETSLQNIFLYLQNSVQVYSATFGKFLSLYKDKNGYYYFNYKNKYVYVHKLVFDTFYTNFKQENHRWFTIVVVHQNSRNDMVVDHIDGCRQNNNPHNLQIVPRGINSSFFINDMKTS